MFMSSNRKMTATLFAILFWVFGSATGSLAGDVPEEAMRHYNRALAAVETAKSSEDYEDAIKEYEEATQAAPEWADPYYGMGLVQEKAGKYRDAVASLKKYLELDPDAADARAVKDRIYQLEYKAEQEITRDEALDIFGLLLDETKWKRSETEITSVPQPFDGADFVQNLNRQGDRIAVTYRSDKQRTAVIYAEVTGNELKFSILAKNVIPESLCPQLTDMSESYNYQIVSRRKVSVILLQSGAVRIGTKISCKIPGVVSFRYEYVRK